MQKVDLKKLVGGSNFCGALRRHTMVAGYMRGRKEEKSKTTKSHSIGVRKGAHPLKRGRTHYDHAVTLDRVINPSFCFHAVSPGGPSPQRSWCLGSSWGLADVKTELSPGWWLPVGSEATTDTERPQ
jgi:hypothetical protein